MHGMKDKKKRIILLAILVVIAASVGIYFLIKYQTYNYVELTTVYENNNEGSHFRPIQDSWKIYREIFKFALNRTSK